MGATDMSDALSSQLKSIRHKWTREQFENVAEAAAAMASLFQIEYDVKQKRSAIELSLLIGWVEFASLPPIDYWEQIN